MKRLKISQGKFRVVDDVTNPVENYGSGGVYVMEKGNEWEHVLSCSNPYKFWNVTIDQARANAELFCDAINTSNKLDKLPSELAADRELLLNALKRAIPCIAIRKEMEDAEAAIKQVEG